MFAIEEPSNHRIALHHLGFRPFFLLASIYAVLAIGAWSWFYLDQTEKVGLLPSVTWHGHEMIFGYGLAVVAGFLLTAVKNWTGIQTLNGTWLILLATLWIFARLLLFLNDSDLVLAAAIADMVFDICLCLAILYPLVKVKQWRQLPVWACLVMLMLANLWFYTALIANNLADTQRVMITGLYIVILLITLMARRVIPFFIEKGTGEKVANYRPVDLATIILFPIFIGLQLLQVSILVPSILALTLAALHSIRLAGWFTMAMLSKPMLWILYAGYCWIAAAFLLQGLAGLGLLNPMLALHAFSYGAIGILTLGMMSRVALGHTGRDIYQRRPALTAAFLCLTLGSLTRVALPLIMPSFYMTFILLSQVIWIMAFALFFWIFCPILILARTDGRYG